MLTTSSTATSPVAKRPFVAKTTFVEGRLKSDSEDSASLGGEVAAATVTVRRAIALAADSGRQWSHQAIPPSVRVEFD